MSTDFEDLLQDVEQMSAITDKENAGLPRLQRTLSQLFEVNKRKLAKTSNYMSSDTNEINASILLAGRGIDAPKLAQTIENLSIQQITMAQHQMAPTGGVAPLSHDTSSFSPFDKFSSMEQLRDVDLQTFLKSEKENALMAIIEETREKTMQEIDDLFASSNESEWEKQKQKIMNELLGSFSSSASTDMGSKTATSTLNTSLSTTQSSRTVMSDIEMEFSKQVFIYNQKLIENQQPQPDLLECFRNLASRINDKNIEEAWKILGFMSKLPTPQFTRCKDFGDNEQHIDRDASNEAQLAFINQALGYLEHSFKELIQSKVNANLKQAKLGGQLGTNALVNAYLRLSISEKFHQLSMEKFEDPKGQQQLLWPSIYLCLRCGDVEAAHAIALKAKKDDIANYLEEIMKDSRSGRVPTRGHLISSSENKLRIEYKSRIKRDNDDYKRVVYCYLCRYGGDDELVNKVLDNVDDFIWFKLNSIENTRTAPAPEGALTFTEFQTKLSVDFGEKYFVTNRNPFTYLQVLLLTAQFEQAIEFMLKFESLVVHGVHMAIGLFEKNLLNIVKSSSATQLFIGGDGPNEPKCFRRINLPCLIKMYTRKFECTDPREALQYYYFLRSLKLTLPAGQRRAAEGDDSERITNYFAQYVCELGLETREFDLLFGKLEKNAVRRPGVLDKFARDDEVSSIIALVADEMENKGRVEEAIKLYDLCKQHQRVFELCNKVMSQLVAEVNAPYSDRDRFKNMVVNIAVRYKTETVMSARAIPRSIVSTFYILTDLMTFFDLYHEENWDVAYETVNKLSVLPTTSIAVDSKVKDFIAFSEEIKRNFPELILATMTIISNLYNKFNKSAMGGSMYQNMTMGGSNEKKMFLNQLKEHAKALIKFVGCIPYRLSGDINARLLQLEVMMN